MHGLLNKNTDRQKGHKGLGGTFVCLYAQGRCKEERVFRSPGNRRLYLPQKKTKLLTKSFLSTIPCEKAIYRMRGFGNA